MASKLQQLQARATQATQFVTKHGNAYYKHLLEQNKQYIKDPPTVETCNELAKQLWYTRLASTRYFAVHQQMIDKMAKSSVYLAGQHLLHQKMLIWLSYGGIFAARQFFLGCIPGRTESFWKELDYVKNMWRHRKELKVEDAGIAALFGIECWAWYCAGEIIGRGFTFTGYYP